MSDSVEVRIELTGLALCFLKETAAGGELVWNVAFLCDEHHPLDLNLNDQPPIPNWRPIGRDLILLVEHSDTSPCQTGNFRKLLNMSHSLYGHGANNQDPPRSNLSISRRKNLTDLVWMQVPHSRLSVSDSEDTKIMRTHPDHGVPKRVADCGKHVRLTFRVTEDFSLTLKDFVSGDVISQIPISIDQTVHDRITLTFHNRCVGDCRRNDFVDLYEFVKHEDDDGNEVQFISWAEDAETEVIVFSDDPGEVDKQQRRIAELIRDGWIVSEERRDSVEIQKRERKELVDARRMSPYGNCDPVGSEPPPGP